MSAHKSYKSYTLMDWSIHHLTCKTFVNKTVSTKSSTKSLGFNKMQLFLEVEKYHDGKNLYKKPFLYRSYNQLTDFDWFFLSSQ